MSLFSPINTRSRGNAFGNGSSEEIIMEATMGYFFANSATLFPVRDELLYLTADVASLDDFRML